MGVTESDTILVTGAAGFIASHVVQRLGAVRGVDSLDERVHPGRAMPAHWQDGWHVQDYAGLRSRDLQGVTTVIHLAAQVSVADSAADPSRYIVENSEGTARFLLKVPTSVRRLVVASSMSVYGEGGIRVREDDPVCPASVYGLTKYDQERLCLIWGAQQGVEVVALRFFNVYGPGQALTNPYTGVLANFASRLLAGKAPQVYEDGQQTRDFIFVNDVADAVVLAASQHVPAGVYNVCTGDPTTVLTAAETMARVLGRDIPPTITGTMRPGDIRHCTGDPSKLEAYGWAPRWTFEAGMDAYGKWLTR